MKLLYVVNITMSILIHNIVNCKYESGNVRGTVVRGIGNGEASDGEDPYAKKLLKESLLPGVGEGQDEGEEIVKAKSVNRPSTAKARTLRRKFTDAEQKLWNHLRGRQISCEKFRRQQPLGRYVVDFVCLEKKLIVEVDGGHHAASAYDEERTSWLESEGFRVVRFWNNEVLGDIASVLDAIYRELERDGINHPHPDPLPSRERVREKSVNTVGSEKTEFK